MTSSSHSHRYSVVGAEEKTKPWGRLVLLVISCTLCAGLVPGMAMYIEQFSKAGIFESLCSGKEDAALHRVAYNGTSKADYCQEQYLAVASVFSNGQMLTLIGQLPVGLLYDRYGPRALGVGGAAGVLTGMLLLQVPLAGAKYGADANTWILFPLAFVLVDFASFANSYCLLGMIFHFPGWSTFVISLWMATYQAAAFQPMLVDCFMKLGCSFSIAILILTGSVGLGLLLCYCSAPSQMEYFDEAKAATGVPLPRRQKSLTLFKATCESNEIICAFMLDFFLMALSGAAMYQFVMLYQGLAANWGHLALGSEKDGEHLAESFVLLTALVGGIAAPGGAIAFDRFGLGLMTSVLVSVMAVANVTVIIRSWPAQVLCTICVVIASTLFSTFITKLSTCYCTANRLGMVQSLLTTYCMILCLLIYGIFSALVANSPGNVSNVGISLLASASTGTLFCIVYSVRFCIAGTPDMPALPKVDEMELCEPFGCTCFDEVLYISHEADKKHVYTILSGTAEGIQEFLLDLDRARMREVSARNGLRMPSPEDLKDYSKFCRNVSGDSSLSLSTRGSSSAWASASIASIGSKRTLICCTAERQGDSESVTLAVQDQ